MRQEGLNVIDIAASMTFLGIGIIDDETRRGIYRDGRAEGKMSWVCGVSGSCSLRN